MKSSNCLTTENHTFKIFILNYMHMCWGDNVHVSACATRGQKGALDPLELELQRIVSCPVVTELGSSARAASLLNH